MPLLLFESEGGCSLFKISEALSFDTGTNPCGYKSIVPVLTFNIVSKDMFLLLDRLQNETASLVVEEREESEETRESMLKDNKVYKQILML